MDAKLTKLKIKLSGVLGFLNEKQKRILVASEALSLGYGGITILSKITGMDPKTIRRGIDDLNNDNNNIDQAIRNSGGGRKKKTDKTPEIKNIIEELIEPDTRGDPESPLRWTCKSVRNISDFLVNKGYEIGRQTVASILHDLEYSLQGNRKTLEGKDHPDRDSQFKFINKLVKKFLSDKSPVISVDTKKKRTDWEL